MTKDLEIVEAVIGRDVSVSTDEYNWDLLQSFGLTDFYGEIADMVGTSPEFAKGFFKALEIARYSTMVEDSILRRDLIHKGLVGKD